MKGSAGVMALVLAETAAGGAAFLFLTPLWREVKRGFFYLTGLVVLVLSLSAAGAAHSAVRAAGRAAGSEGRLAVTLSLALAAVTVLWLGLMLFRLRLVPRLLGVASAPVALAMLVAFARTGDEGVGLAFFQLLAGAAFTGAVLDGLLLGHWYLTDRRLPRGPINRMAWALVAAVVVEAVAVIAGGFSGSGTAAAGPSSTLSPILVQAGVASWIAIGMVAITGLTAAFIQVALRGARPSAVQSATGFFYLAVITAFTAELAAKVTFLR
jgi:hypothetical protein